MKLSSHYLNHPLLCSSLGSDKILFLMQKYVHVTVNYGLNETDVHKK